MLFPHLKTWDVKEYMRANDEQWQREGAVLKMIWEDSDYLSLLARGPAPLKIFHKNPGDEIFFQIEGDLYFHFLNAEGAREQLVVKPGEMFLLPAKVPHSVRRPANSWTVVVERKRRPGEQDYWTWYCEQCNVQLDEYPCIGPVDTYIGAMPSEMVDSMNRVRALEKCPECGAALPLPPG